MTNFNKLALLLCLVLPAASQARDETGAPVVQTLGLIQGDMTDYGATPWYTSDISVGVNGVKYALDTGSNFIWTTSDLCNTPACNAHSKVNTSQPHFQWLDKTPTKRSFGAWGSMTTFTGQAPFFITPSGAMPVAAIPFFAATEYEGARFQYLAWDGGIGFPSRSDHVEPGSGFFLYELWRQKEIPAPGFGILTDASEAPPSGIFTLGGPVPDMYYDKATEIRLEPKETPDGYLWGTELYDFRVGQVSIPAPTFILDTGSSRFKGDKQYVLPILEEFIKLTDADGAPIFSKIEEDSDWVGLMYVKGEPGYYDNLPDIELVIGQSCAAQDDQRAVIALGPEQYSYFVRQGDREGYWVLAFHILADTGGILVGSTFMDLLVTNFEYAEDAATGALEQGNMYLYQKTNGEGPKSVSCESS